MTRTHTHNQHDAWHPKYRKECMELCYSFEPLTKSLFIRIFIVLQAPPNSPHRVYVGYRQSEIKILSNPQSGEKTHTCKITNEWYFCIFFVMFWADSPNFLIVCKKIKKIKKINSQNKKKINCERFVT